MSDRQKPIHVGSTTEEAPHWNSLWNSRIELRVGDITEVEADAIVNAANPTLLGGGGVDGAIHEAAGPDLWRACRVLGGCPTGEARISPGFLLLAQHVIHAVGPVWQGGDKGERETLAKTWRSALTLAAEHNIDVVAFPAISTGAYGFPLMEACRIAVHELRMFLSKNETPWRVILVAFDSETCNAYEEALDQEKWTALDDVEKS